MRGVGITTRAVRTVPESLVPVLVVVTGLGDPVFVAAVATFAYWIGPRYDLFDRHTGATVVAVTYVALAATVLLKAGFAMPRPPVETMLIPADGAGFPSGHATGATAAYVSLAVFVDRGSSRLRYGVASALVLVVALSRVFLGVHYVVDVLAGIAVGLLTLAAVRFVAKTSLAQAFAMGIPFALGGTLLDPTVDAALVVGLVTGATVGWWLVRETLTDRRLSTARLAMALVGGLLLVGIGYLSANLVVAGFAAAGTGTLFLAVPGLEN